MRFLLFQLKQPVPLSATITLEIKKIPEKRHFANSKIPNLTSMYFVLATIICFGVSGGSYGLFGKMFSFSVSKFDGQTIMSLPWAEKKEKTYFDSEINYIVPTPSS